MSRRSLKNLTGSLGGSQRKIVSYSWEIDGSNYVRKIAFKALKDGEKLGFGLGGEGQRTEVVCVREGTQSYWKGLEKGYKIVTVNGRNVDDITVKSSIKDVATGAKDFTIGFQVPNKPDWADSDKDGVNAFADDTGPPADDQPEEQKEDVPKEKPDLGVVTEEPIIDKGEDDTPIIDNGEEDTPIIDKGEEENVDTDEEYASLTKLSEEVKETEKEDLSEETLAKATKAELEEMKRRKEEEYKKLKDHEERLRELIKKKEKEFKEAVTRQNLEDLKNLRRQKKEVTERAKHVLAELDRIRRMLELRIGQLAAGIRDLAAASAARDAKLRELEAEVKLLEGKVI